MRTLASHLGLVLASVAFLGCSTVQASSQMAEPGPTRALVKELFVTPLAPPENLDSPAAWHGPDGQHWLFATAKSSHSVLVYDALNGIPIRRLGGQGAFPGQFNRPNGIWVIDDYLFVVERDNQRVQVLSLPDLVSVATFGENDLEYPYGLWVQKVAHDEFRVYVTDNYVAGEDEDDPDHALLGRRIKVFEVEAEGADVEGELIQVFGETSGEGVLHAVESLHGDPAHNRLLIADENEYLGLDIKIYDLQGRYTGQIRGDGIFLYEPEGIALYESDVPGGGYWIATDQGKLENLFHIFDRRSLAHVGTFSGEFTLNTDGIWLTQGNHHPRFPEGLFYTVHNDEGVTAFSLTEILQALQLN